MNKRVKIFILTAIFLLSFPFVFSQRIVSGQKHLYTLGLETGYSYRKSNELGFGINLYRSNFNYKNTIVQSVSLYPYLLLNPEKSGFGSRLSFDLSYWNENFKITPTIGLISELNQNERLNFGIRAGVIIYKSVYLVYNYSFFNFNENLSQHSVGLILKFNFHQILLLDKSNNK